MIVVGIRMGLSAPTADRLYPQWRIGYTLKLAVRSNKLRNVWYELQV